MIIKWEGGKMASINGQPVTNICKCPNGHDAWLSGQGGKGLTIDCAATGNQVVCSTCKAKLIRA